MFFRTGLFVIVFALIAPQSRTFLFDLFGNASEKVQAAAPTSYAVMGVLAVAGVLSVFLVQSGVQRRGPEDPMARYRKDVLD